MYQGMDILICYCTKYSMYQLMDILKTIVVDIDILSHCCIKYSMYQKFIHRSNTHYIKVWIYWGVNLRNTQCIKVWIYWAIVVSKYSMHQGMDILNYCFTYGYFEPLLLFQMLNASKIWYIGRSNTQYIKVWIYWAVIVLSTQYIKVWIYRAIVVSNHQCINIRIFWAFVVLNTKCFKE